MRIRGTRRWWGLAIGAVSGVFDTSLALWLGFDLSVAGRDLTLPVAVFLSTNFAAMCFAIGYLLDAREQARDDAATISAQLAEIESSQRAAAQNEKLAAIGRLAAGIAHEVRNPLGVIRASASMVQESFDPDDEAHRACRFICEESDRLNGLITSLLAFARPTAPKRRPVHLEKVIDRALDLAGPELARRRIRMEREGAGGVPEIHADPDLLAQAVLDLVTNAAEAVEDDGRIVVRVRGDAAVLDVEVADDGPGVDPDDGDRVFEPFYTTKASGTGLGLSMTARIAETHGGHVALVSGAGAGPGGGGACFRLRLPLAHEEAGT